MCVERAKADMASINISSCLFLIITVVIVFPVSCCCIECEFVLVDKVSGSNCSTIDPLPSRFENRTCNSLETVFSLIETATSGSVECFSVIVGPGTHIVNRSFDINKGLKLTAAQNSNVRVVLNVPNKQHYALSLHNAKSEVILNGIEFVNSSGILRFHNITSITIRNCSFRSFFQSAVEIYNCPAIFIDGSVFEQISPALFIKEKGLSGYGCGLSLSYTDEMMATDQRIVTRITDCTFRNNSNILPKEFVQSTEQVLSSFHFVGRGGGCAVIIQISRVVDLQFHNVLFADNQAQSFGGGLFMVVFSNAAHTISLNKVVFLRNLTPLGSGGMGVSLLEGTATAVLSMNVSNCEFTSNRANFGGGTSIFIPGSARPGFYSPSLIKFENTTFTSNIASEFGAAIEMILLEIFEARNGIQPVVIRDCQFIGNECDNGGTLATSYMPVQFDGHNSFYHNNGRAVVNVASLITIRGDMTFFGNTAVGVGGGALFSTSLGQFKLYQGANLEFAHNQGLLGSAVIVQNEHYIPEVFASLWHNPLCFLQYEDTTVPPDLWKNVSITFSSNKAVVGSTTYISDLSTCSWSGPLSPFFDLTRVMRWNFVNSTNDNRNIAHSDSPYEPAWYVQTPAVDLSISNQNIIAYPGEVFQVGLHVVDEVGNPTASIVRISEDNDLPRIAIRPSLVNVIHISNDTSYINISTAMVLDVETSILTSVESLINHKANSIPRSTFNLTLVACPPGYMLTEFNRHITCTCDGGNLKITTCQGTKITLTGNVWVSGYVNSQETLLSVYDTQQFTTYPCPSGYCRCKLQQYDEKFTTCYFVFDSSQQDSQCHCDREGILCGGCKNSLGVSVLLNNCVSCSDAYSLLIVVLVLIDVAVFVGFFWLVKHFPTWVYPSLFYIQILPYVTEHSPWTFEQVRPYVYYVSSALSYYFAYDFCLFHNMSSLMSFTLRFLPFFLAVITIGVLLTIKYFLKKPRKPWNGLWWIVLPMYTHVVHTCMSVLNCPSVSSPGSSPEYLVPRWYIDGSVTCFEDLHVGLGLLAVLVLLFCIAIIPILTLYTSNWLKRPRWLGNLGLALRKHFKERYGWWSSIELSRRLLMVFVIVVSPGFEYPAIMILGLIIVVYGICQPYSDRLSLIIEIVLSVDVLILLLLKTNLREYAYLDGVPTSVLNSSAGNLSDCSTQIGLSHTTWILLPFYYLPLVLMLCTVVGCVVGYVVGCAVVSTRHIMLPESKQTSTEDADNQLSSRTNPQVTTTVLDLHDLSSTETTTSRQRAKTEEAQSDTMASKMDKPTRQLRFGGRMFSNNVAMDRQNATKIQLDDIKHVLNKIATGLDPVVEYDESV